MSSELIYIGLGLIIGLGISMQWLAKIFRIPGIILLLPAGMIVGPVLGLVRPQEIFGDTLFPLVTIGVGILLLKGGLELRLKNLQPGMSRSVWRLVTVGVILTLFIGTVAALFLFHIPPVLAFLLSALLVVSGPTVVGPILSFARPKEPVGTVLQWEGIIIDPIGAALAVAAISFITAENPNPFLDIFLTMAVGVMLGIAAALIYTYADRTRNIPRGLGGLIALMLGIVVVTVGELIFSEAGLFAALTMGFVIANQRLTPFGSIRVLTETLEPLIIGILFIMLAAMVDLGAMVQYLVPALVLVAIYVLVARPLAGFLATHGLGYSNAQRIFIGALHPRGIVAAATASLFALNLAEFGVDFPEMVPVVFTVILATVIIYGLGTPVLSRVLKIADPEPTGIAVYGEQHWALDLAAALHTAGATVMVLAPGSRILRSVADSGKIPFEAYTGSLADLADEEVLNDAHFFKMKVAWLLIASSNRDSIGSAEDAFIDSIGPENMIIFGSDRDLQDRRVFGGKIDILAKTPYGLFGRNEDELLDMLENGYSFRAIDNREQPQDGGTPEGTRAFLRVNRDGTLAVPGSDSRLEDGESLIIITKKHDLPKKDTY
ncbi:cation:proton antiporter [Methanogenium organophilum]|uniref:Sodium:proton antiporter n=1 Tax=Methanogenium organophilum TaxID=2199 RepID=A0A9X9T9A1_METOG|nr:sodium:proton antiporter [Methanogenium organophilum]WAI02201.1 sodium:proton antiporter [Methanogenium organophilum]